MFIAVHHDISDPGQFWASAQKNLPNLPEGGVKRVCNVFPAKGMTEATCIWEAESIESLDAYLRSKVQNWSTEKYFEIDAANAMGLAQ